MSSTYDCYVDTPLEKISDEDQLVLGSYCGGVVLHAGESDSEYTDRISQEIWDEVGKYIPLRIGMTYLEDPPVETFEFDNRDYLDYIQEKREEEE